MRKSLITLLLLCTVALVHAATLKGIVKDCSTGESLIGATIYVKETTSGVATDLDGRFEIADIQQNECTLIVSFISYKTKELNIQLTSQIVDVEIVLEPDNLELGEVTVVARKNLEGVLALQKERQKSNVAIENIGAKELSIKGISDVQEGV